MNLLNEMYYVLIHAKAFEQAFLKSLMSLVYSQPVDYSKNYSSNGCLDFVKDTILNDDYDNVLTIVEFFFSSFSSVHNYGSLDSTEALNDLLEQEYVGYRFIDNKIIPITNDEELSTIDEALSETDDKPKEHIEKAIQLFSDRNNPDYENSIKESITAVEAMCVAIIGEKGTLTHCLAKLKEYGITIHPAMAEAFKKLYAYTSDASGIRHAGDIGGPSASFADAKYMLVTCSAFINYLREITAAQ